jgi:hypothetical protein
MPDEHELLPEISLIDGALASFSFIEAAIGGDFAEEVRTREARPVGELFFRRVEIPLSLLQERAKLTSLRDLLFEASSGGEGAARQRALTEIQQRIAAGDSPAMAIQVVHDTIQILGGMDVAAVAVSIGVESVPAWELLPPKP